MNVPLLWTKSHKSILGQAMDDVPLMQRLPCRFQELQELPAILFTMEKSIAWNHAVETLFVNGDIGGDISEGYEIVGWCDALKLSFRPKKGWIAIMFWHPEYKQELWVHYPALYEYN